VDIDGFDEWYLENYRDLHASLTIVLADGDRATEAVDEAFVRALERWPRVRAMSSPSGWVYTVARNAARRSMRQVKREQQVAEALHDDHPGAAPDDVVVVWDAVRRLESRQREVIALRYFLDLKERDVAATLGLAPGTVARLLHDARKQLAGDLKLEERRL